MFSIEISSQIISCLEDATCLICLLISIIDNCFYSLSVVLRIKIADLGIARIQSESTLAVTTNAGTQMYMSPELYLGEGYTFPNDIWALGVIAYQLCTLKHPFIGPTPAALMNNILNKTPLPIPQFDKEDTKEQGLLLVLYCFIYDD